MLYLIPGTYDPQKREYVHGKISEAIDAGLQAILFVPEQSAFERERAYLLDAGAVKASRLTVTGFSRIIRTLLDDTGLRLKTEADEASRAVVMSLACDAAADSLSIFSGYARKPRLIGELLSEYDALRRSGLTADDALEAARQLDGGGLKDKLTELSAIFGAYEAILSRRFSNDADNIPAATEYLKNHDVFSDAAVFIDGFHSVTAVQLSLIGQLIRQAKDVYVTIKADDVFRDGPDDAFGESAGFAASLRRLAAKLGVPVKKIPADPLTDDDPVIKAVHENFFAARPAEYEGQTDRVVIGSATDKYEECRLVALLVRDLVGSGELRCRDVVIVERGDGYAMPMASALRKYGLPVFRDRSAKLTEFPPVKMLLCAVKTAVAGFSTETVLSYLKTGMTGLTPSEISALETYVYVWQLDGNAAWTTPFTASPAGYDEKPGDSARAALAELNRIRETAVSPLVSLRSAVKKASGRQLLREVWRFAEDAELRDRFCDYAEAMDRSGDAQGALLASSVWDALVRALDSLYGALEDADVTPARFAELLEIIFDSTEIGRVPAGIDEIQIVRANRVRFNGPRAVFLVGANYGVFPAEITDSGLFTAREKKNLAAAGFALDSTPEKSYDEERLTTFCAVAATADRLYVTYSLRSLDGAELKKGEIVDRLIKIFPHAKRTGLGDYTPADRTGSPETAFSEYAAAYGQTGPQTAALREYCLSEPSLAGRLAALDRAAGKRQASFDDPDVAKRLFGDVMMISASRAESYYSCPFGYFCQYGLGIYKPEIAALDNRIRGNMIHEVLEKLLRRYDRDSFVALERGRLLGETSALAEKYVSDYMGGRDGKSASVNRQIDNVKSVLYDIVPRLQSEFAVSGFSYSDMELGIGVKPFDKVPPYEVPLSDGGLIKIIGKVDRVDTYRDERGEFVRVVDYKSGAKEFSAGDMLDGSNLQMAMYLFCIIRGKTSPYAGDAPAGILYVPAKADDAGGNDLGRDDPAEKAEDVRRENGKLFGCVLEDPAVIDAMNPALIRDLKKKKDGSYANALSPKEFRGLEKKLNELMRGMGEGLRGGRIEALPLQKDKKVPCDYCKYADVCLREASDPVREATKTTHEKVRRILNETEENADG